MQSSLAQAYLPVLPSMAASRKRKPARVHSSKGFNATAFYEVLASVVEARSVAWRQVARETGITPSTLTRMGQGRQPDASSLAALSAWAGLNPADFVGQPREAVRLDPLVVISRALRSDPDLQPEAVKALEDIMRIAYDRFSRQSV
jgi:transcriptional regulator with XRE-family HTH domain